MKAKKAKLTAKQLKQMESTNPARCVGVLNASSNLEFPSRDLGVVPRMVIPSVQEALGCIGRLKRQLAVSTPGLAAVLGFPSSTVMAWVARRSNPEPAARLLLPRLERELIPQDATDPAQDTPTGSVQPGEDVIFSDASGH